MLERIMQLIGYDPEPNVVNNPHNEEESCDLDNKRASTEKSALIENDANDLNDKTGAENTKSNDGDSSESSRSRKWKALFSRRGVFFAFVAGILLGCEGILAIRLYDAGIHPLETGFIRCLVLFLPIPFVSWGKSTSYTKVDLGLFILFGLLDLNQILLQYMAYNYAEIGNVNTIISCTPIPTSILACVLFGERLSVIEIGGIVAISSGILLVSKPPFIMGILGNPYELNNTETIGTLIALVSLFAFSFQILTGRKLSYRSADDPILLTVSTGFVGIPLMILILSVTDTWSFPQGFDTWRELCIYCVIVGVENLLNNAAICLEEAAVVTIMSSSVAPASFILEVILLHVHPGILSIVGAIVILASTVVVALSMLYKRRR